MRHAPSQGRSIPAPAGQRCRATSSFVESAVSGHFFNNPAASVACLEVADADMCPPDPSQFRLDQADFFEKILEVQTGQSAKTSKCVGCRNGLGRFPGVLRSDNSMSDLPKRCSIHAAPGRDASSSSCKLLREGRDKMRLLRDGLLFKILQHCFEGAGTGPRAASEPVRPEVSRFPQLLAAIDACRELG